MALITSKKESLFGIVLLFIFVGTCRDSGSVACVAECWIVSGFALTLKLKVWTVFDSELGLPQS